MRATVFQSSTALAAVGKPPNSWGAFVGANMVDRSQNKWCESDVLYGYGITYYICDALIFAGEFFEGCSDDHYKGDVVHAFEWSYTGERDGATAVTLHHANLPDDEMGRGHKDGWAGCLDKLAEQIETANPSGT